MKQFQTLTKVIHNICNIFCWISSLALFIMMALTFLDVLGRYLFKAPIIGALDISEQLMVVVISCALGQVTINRSHIRADLLVPILSERKYSILSAICFLIAAVPVFFMATHTTWEAWKTLMNLRLTTQTIKLPIAPFYAMAALGLILLFLEIIFDIIRYLMEARAESLK